MFSFLSKKACRRTIFAVVPLILAGLLFASCGGPTDPDPINAAQPVIISIQPQPQSGTFDVGTDETYELTVTASVTDGGSLSYQWYSNTSKSTTGGTAIISGGTSATLALAKASYTTNGNYYFYVVVTNTNNNVTGNKTTSVASNVATVTVSGNGSSEPDVVIPAEIAGYFQSELAFYPGWGFIDDGFAIDATAKTFYYYMDSTLETYWGGTIVRLIEQDDESGEPAILIIEITDVEGDWYSDPPEEGKYFAAAYKNPTSFAVSSSTAYYSSYNDPNKEDPKYPDPTDAKNTGVDTIAEAISEYTAANGYFPASFPLYYSRSVSAVTLGDLIGDWYGDEDNDWMEDYRIHIRGNTYTEFMDGEEYDGIYDPTADEDDMLALMGLIVDCTDTTQASGLLYVYVIDGGMVYSNSSYVAVAWNKKDGNSIQFITGYEEDSLAEAKETYSSVSDFDEDDFYPYVKD
jgi:hypothetical protein